MSLLNAALRKRARENEHRAGSRLTPDPGSGAPGRGRMRAYLIVLALAAAGTLAGIALIDTFYLRPPSPPPLSGSVPAPSETPEKTQPPALPAAAADPAPTLVAPAPSAVPRPAPPAPAARVRPPAGKPAAAAADPAMTDRFYRKGLAYHRRGRPQDAIPMYRDALAREPTHLGAMGNLAAALIATSQFAEALALLDTLDTLSPGNPLAALNRAVARIGLGQPERALADLDKAQALSGAPAFDIHFHRGVALSRLGRFEEAIASYRLAADLQAEDPRLNVNMALAYDRIGDYPAAIAHYTRALASGDGAGSDTAAVEARIRELTAYLVSRAGAAAANTAKDR